MRNGFRGFPPGHLLDLTHLGSPSATHPTGPRRARFDAGDYPTHLYSMVVPDNVYTIYVTASAGGAGGTATGPVNGQNGGATELSVNGVTAIELNQGQNGATMVGGVARLRVREFEHGALFRVGGNVQEASPPSGPVSADNKGRLWTGGAGQLGATPSPGGTGHFSGYGAGGVSANGTNGAGAGASCDQLAINVAPGDRLEILVGRRGTINSTAGSPGEGQDGFMLIEW